MEYFLYLSTPWPVTLASDRFKIAGILPAPDRRLNPMGVFSYITQAPGVDIDLQQVLEFSRYREPIEKAFEMRPSLKLVFHVSEFEYDRGGQYAGIISMLRTVSSVLAYVSGDAIMLSQANDLLLHRRGEQLLLNTEWDFWTPYRISQINLPYHLRALPSALSA